MTDAEKLELEELRKYKKAQRANEAKRNKRASELYDRLVCLLPKEKKKSFDETMKKRGFTSISAYINALIEEDISRQ